VARRSALIPRSRRSSGVARDWGAGTGSVSATAISGGGKVILGSGVQTVGSELTLLRTRGILDMFLLSATSAGDGFFGAMGIGVFTDQAFTAGVASLPSPRTEQFSNAWLYHTYVSVHAGVAGGLEGGREATFRDMVDSKAMRKFDANQVMVAILDVAEIGTAVMQVHFDTRILFQDSGR